MKREEMIEKLARDPAPKVADDPEKQKALQKDKQNGVVEGTRIVGLEEVGNEHVFVLCPKRNEVRSSALCKSCCASQNWCDEYANKIRNQCPVWQELKDKGLV